ncbi:MAG: hypothetical protein ACT4OL_07635 [Nitrospiraceae bacterium]
MVPAVLMAFSCATRYRHGFDPPAFLRSPKCFSIPSLHMSRQFGDRCLKTGDVLTRIEPNLPNLCHSHSIPHQAEQTFAVQGHGTHSA